MILSGYFYNAYAYHSTPNLRKLYQEQHNNPWTRIRQKHPWFA